MGFQIEDGTGKGYAVQVTSENAIRGVVESHHIQHHFSRIYGQVYQIPTVYRFVGAGTHTLLHMRNTSTINQLGVTYIRLQGVDFSATLPTSGSYVSVGRDTEYSSGGELLTPVNVNFGSGNQAEAIAYRNPIVTGTFTEFDRWYVQPNASEERYEKWGSVILGQNDTLEIRLITEMNTGVIHCRITFLYFSETLQ